MTDLLIATDHSIEITGVINGVTAAAITTATVTVTLTNNADDVQIVGATWPLTMPHIAAGTYRVTLPDTLTLLPCTTCKAVFTIDGGAGLYRTWETLYVVANGTTTATILVDGTDHVLTVDGLEDALNPGTYLNSATVEVTLTDISDVDIPGETFPLAMAYVAASNGKYQATLRDTLDVAPGDAVKVLITADNGAGYHREWRSILTVQTGT